MGSVLFDDGASAADGDFGHPEMNGATEETRRPTSEGAASTERDRKLPTETMVGVSMSEELKRPNWPSEFCGGRDPRHS